MRTAPRTPHDIPYTDIEVSLGVPWVSKTIISDFIYFLRTGNEAFAATGKMLKTYVSYEPMTGYWYVEDKNLWGRDGVDRKQLEHTYGLPSYNALYILEAALNLREIRRETEEETLAALEKQEVIEKLFKEWVWQDEDRRWEIEEAYNRIFQGCRAKEYSGRELKFPEMSPDVTLFDYQKDAVMRVISEKNTLLAFDVGAGKTYIMIAAAMKMRQEGKSRKNLFVVPNHIVGQWELIFKQMYPAAKVLSVGPGAFRPQLRQKVLGQIQRGDYDGIIMAYSCFEMIPLSEKYLMEQMKQKLRELDASLPERHPPGIGPAVDREKEYLGKQIAALISMLKGPADAITFDQLEINTLFVDEAHNFKNIPLRSNLKRISGINITGSKKCLEMLHKVRCVQDNNQGRGAVFATGTPLCNSISDAYAMQMYLQYDKMKETHLDRFDNWVKSFAKPERVCEIDVDTSKYRFVLRFARFFNLPELMNLFKEVADIKTADQLNLPTPEVEYHTVASKPTMIQQAMVKELSQRASEVHTGRVDPRKDNMLKITSDGRKLGLDQRVISPTLPDEPGTKVNCCVENILQQWREGDGKRLTQLVFCDISTPKAAPSKRAVKGAGDKLDDPTLHMLENAIPLEPEKPFTIYEDIRQRLIAGGMRPEQVAFIHEAKTDVQKKELFAKVRSGQVRVLIGSTFNMGAGTNVQDKLIALHELFHSKIGETAHGWRRHGPHGLPLIPLLSR